MSEAESGVQDPVDPPAAAAFMRADRTCAFGPSFFLGHLGRFVRDRCPDAAEQLPVVHVHLADGVTLDVCHIIGVSPHWAMLAVRDGTGHREEMAVELVPYEIIRRVGIASKRNEASSIGFFQARPPAVIEPETLLRAAMAPDTNATGRSPSV